MIAPAVVLAVSTVSASVDRYVERYFDTYPSKATEAGRSGFDDRLEDLSPARLEAWVAFGREIEGLLQAALRRSPSPDDALDAEAVLAHLARERHDLTVKQRAKRDPQFWTGVASSATVFLLVRDDRPLPERVEQARARVRQLPRLVTQARQALANPEVIVGEVSLLAAGQARALAQFYREGFPALAVSAGGLDTSAIRAEGEAAARALDSLGVFLDDLGRRGRGSPRLGPLYAESFRLGTGISEPIPALLVRALADLGAKRQEAAAYGREAWAGVFPGEAAPSDDTQLLRRLFARLAEDRARTVEEFVEDYRTQVRTLEAFVRERAIVSLPDPLTVFTARSPAFFAGQSVGGVYPAGPYAPEAKTLFYLPTPSDRATPEERDGFFRDFNHHFNVMITPHEILPGHYLQLKWAARHPRKVRALFADGVYVEGWGTFCERLLLDLGWGGPLPRLAHLKKQLENTARAVVDIRVHTQGMTREEVLRFVREDALQDEQFAANMWMRAITSSPQLASYWLGYRQMTDLHEDVKRVRGASYRLRDFTDAMMELGPVPVRHYRERLLGAGS
ncbi:MAG TPA: DUF885 domain-containing protein [Vicinamibacteria bacterium]|nr:DUF885 domain-containing protein [Vicinamibacteria bacterium]